MNTSRPLDSMEQALILTEQLSPLTVVGVMRLSNGPTPMKLREALSILQRRLPVLQARIEQEDDRQILAISPDTPPIPMQHQTRQDDEQWRAVVDSELNRQVETNPGPLLRCTYLSSPNGDALSELVLAFHHVLVDAVAGLHLCHLLLEVCQMAGATETAEDAATVQALPPAAATLFPPAYTGLGRIRPLARFMIRQLADEFRYRRLTASRPLAPIHPQARCRTLTVKLDQAASRTLAKRARQRRLSLNNVLNSALLLAVQRCRHSEEHLAMRAIFFANLRPYLSQQPDVEALGCYMAMLRYTFDIGPKTELWALASRIQETSYRSNRRGEKFMASSLASQLMQTTIRSSSDRMAHTALSYGGPLELQRAYGKTRVLDLHAFIANNYLGPEYTAFARMFLGELCWDIVYLDTDMDHAGAMAIAREMIAILRTAP